jgi:hypothetical protein
VTDSILVLFCARFSGEESGKLAIEINEDLRVLATLELVLNHDQTMWGETKVWLLRSSIA